MAYLDLIFPYYLMNGTIWKKRTKEKKNLTEHKMHVSNLPTNLSETFLTQRKTERDMIQSVYQSSCKVPVIIVRI